MLYPLDGDVVSSGWVDGEVGMLDPLGGWVGAVGPTHDEGFGLPTTCR